MDSTKPEDLVVHLVNVPNFWRGRANTRLLMPGMAGAFVVVATAVIRTANGADRGLLGSLAIAIFVVGLLFVYAYMRRWNATVFVRGGRVGVTNWLALSQEAPIESVNYLRRSAEIWSGEQLPRGVLFIVTKDPKHSIRFGGGDRLEPGGLERIADRLRVPIEGSWTDLPTWTP